MSQPLVSVVIPSYNRAQYIAETIDSVLAQTYSNVEIIVIDDGSTDNTREVVKGYVPRVQYVWQVNSERGASRNHGLRLSKGEYIAFLDSDDLWPPTKLEYEIEVLEANPQYGVSYGDAAQIDADGHELRTLKTTGYSGKVTEQLLQNNLVFMGTHLMRTDVAKKVGGFREERELSGSEDWEFWVRVSTQTDFVYLPRVAAKIRTHPSNTMTDPEAMKRSMSCAARIMEASDYLTAGQKKQLTRTRAMIALVNAINYCSGNQKKRAFASLKESVSINPLVLGDLRFAYTLLRLTLGDRVVRFGRR